MANTSASHTTLLKKGRHTPSNGPLWKPISILFEKQLVHSRVSEGRPDFFYINLHLGLRFRIHAQHGRAVLGPLVLRHEDDSVALTNPGGLII